MEFHVSKYWFYKKICRLLKLEYILLPQTFGPYDSREAQNKARKSIDASSLVLTRDEMSYDCIKNMLPFKEVLKTIDVAFSFLIKRSHWITIK